MTKSQRPSWIVLVLITFALAILIQVPPVILLFIRRNAATPSMVAILILIYAVVFGLIIWWAYRVFIKYRRWQPTRQTFLQRLGWIFGGWLTILLGEQLLNVLNYVI